jgi:hypothetical protein
MEELAKVLREQNNLLQRIAVALEAQAKTQDEILDLLHEAEERERRLDGEVATENDAPDNEEEFDSRLVRRTTTVEVFEDDVQY